ncbi:MAG: aminotransferase class IV [Ferruginibacter sp.]|nr:aminotransferase class IV [Ferruginibacter sp.]
MNQYVIINGALVAKEEAKVSIYDLAVQRGYGIFDFFKTINGEPVWLDDHLDRFYFSAAEMFMKVPVQRSELKKLLWKLMDKNNLPNSGVRLTLTGGESTNGYSLQCPSLLISQEPLVYNKALFETGIRLVTFTHQRQLPHIKTIDYLQAIRLQPFIKEKGAQDILYHFNSTVLEGPRWNFFIVDERGEICTPATNILKGVTRKKIIEHRNLHVKEIEIHPDELATTREAFITSTTKIVLPVLNIDGYKVGTGKPGNITREIWQQLMVEQKVN